MKNEDSSMHKRNLVQSRGGGGGGGILLQYFFYLRIISVLLS
jgi:hypothetical protein